MEAELTSLATGKSWRRLAPIAIVYFIASNIVQFVRQFIVLISVAAYSANKFDFIDSPYFVPGAVLVAVVIVVSGVVNYWFYQYRIRDQHIEIRSGMIKRRNLNLPFWRIQNVKIEQPFYYRMTNYTVVILDTAGSGKEEAKIVAVDRSDAGILRQEILASASDHKSVIETESGAEEHGAADSAEQATAKVQGSDERVINRRSLFDLVLHGLTNNRVWIFLGAAAPFYQDISGYVFDWVESLGLSIDALFPGDNVAWWQLGLYVISSMMVILGLMALISVGGSVLIYYNYTLTRTADRYIRRSGLLSLQEVSMRETRVQLVSVKQDWLDFLLKRANFFFEQNKTGANPEQELHATNKLVVPSVTTPEAQALAADAMPDNVLYDAPYKQISKRFIGRWVILGALPLFLLLSAAGVANDDLKVFLISVPLLAAHCLLIYLRWRAWGIWQDDNYCYVRKGIIGIDRYCFPLHKVQQVAVTQSVLMQRRGLANIRYVLASGDVTVPYLGHAYCVALADKVLSDVETQRRSWM